jgi:hypothetical protein
MTPDQIVAVGAWPTLVFILIVAVGKLWSELMESLRREDEA